MPHPFAQFVQSDGLWGISCLADLLPFPPLGKSNATAPFYMDLQASPQKCRGVLTFKFKQDLILHSVSKMGNTWTAVY